MRCAGQSIRLRGRNLVENEHVKLGAYHTLELEPHRAFTLEKPCWDALDIERIKQACDPRCVRRPRGRAHHRAQRSVVAGIASPGSV